MDDIIVIVFIKKYFSALNESSWVMYSNLLAKFT